MGTHWIAEAVFNSGSFFDDLVSNNATVQFIHRTTGWLILFLASIIFYLRKEVETKIQKRSLTLLCIITAIQFTLGVFTLVFMVPIPLALSHQGGAVLLLILTIKSIHLFAPSRSSLQF